MLTAFHGKQSEKDRILAQIEAHRLAGELVQGHPFHWSDGKGGAAGCTIHSADYMEYEARFGIPAMLAALEDQFFERLPGNFAAQWPERFMDAIRPGADLSRVGWQFLHWLITDETINPGIGDPIVRDAVAQCVDVLAPLLDGCGVNLRAARDAAARADDASYAVWEALYVPGDSWEGAIADCAAMSAGEAARSAVRSGYWDEDIGLSSGADAARAIDNVAFAAGLAAPDNKPEAMKAAYIRMSDKLIELLRAAPDARQ